MEREGVNIKNSAYLLLLCACLIMSSLPSCDFDLLLWDHRLKDNHSPTFVTAIIFLPRVMPSSARTLTSQNICT